MKFFFSQSDARLLDLKDALELAAELGMGLELPYDLYEAIPSLPKAEEIKRLGERFGVEFTVHLPFVDLNIASLFPKSYAASLERTKDGLAFAKAVGAKVAVLHTGLVPLRHPLAVDAAWRRLREALSALRPLPVPVALENLALTEYDLIQGPEELKKLLDEFGDYGFCLDYSHAFLEGGEERVRGYLDLLSDRLIHLHLNDTDGTKDLHLPVGAGVIPFERLLPPSLPETATFEVRGGAEALKRSERGILEAWGL